MDFTEREVELEPLTRSDDSEFERGAGASVELRRRQSHGTVVKPGCSRYGGILLGLLTSLLFAGDILLVKLLQGHGLDGKNCVFWIYVGKTTGALPLIILFEYRARRRVKFRQSVGNFESNFEPIWPLSDPERCKTFFGLIAPGLIGPIATLLRYTALQYIEMADGAVIFNSSPIIISIMAHFLLNEKTGLVPILSAVFAMCGAVVISKPPILTGAAELSQNTLIGTALAILSLLIGCLQAVLMRKMLVTSIHFSLLSFTDAVLGLVETFLINQMIFGGITFPQETTARLLVLALGACAFSTRTCFIFSLKLEKVEVISLVGTTGIVFAFLAQFVFLGILPDQYSGFGSVLIFTGIIVTSFRKYLTTLPRDHKWRKAMSCLLY